jgi:hypothetical protein
VRNPQQAMYSSAARRGDSSAEIPRAMSTAPTSGISTHARGSGMPTRPKYGTQAALVMTPKAPWPTNSAATATRQIQWIATAPDPTPV